MAFACSIPQKALSKQTPLELPTNPRAPQPQGDSRGRGAFNERRGISGGGTRRAAAQKTKMAAVRLPPARERKRPNGDGFSPGR